MSNLLVMESLSLDGVMQAPGRPDEDRAAASRTAAGRCRTTIGDGPGDGRQEWRGVGPLLVRATDLRGLLGVWPKRKDNPFTRGARQRPEVRRVNDTGRAAAVAELDPARRGRRETPWPGSRAAGQGILVLGSGELVQIADAAQPGRRVRAADPSARAGIGRRLFRRRRPVAALQLVDTVTTTTGVIIATYRAAKPTAQSAES